jgi:predicted RNA-binding Zn-ribbon protein involved in translation (DUF1610 family)
MKPLELKPDSQHLCTSCGRPLEDATEQSALCASCCEMVLLKRAVSRFGAYMSMSSTAFRGRR